ncbi:MAG: hypothetical protein FJ245_09795 [Nitrospira sp.]|nr:hypothetical protein [Nitrospira sp.]
MDLQQQIRAQALSLFGEGAAILPRRYLAYMVGSGTPLYLKIVQQLVALLGARIDSMVFVVGDLPSYRRALQESLDRKIKLVYQHQDLDPLRRPPQLDEGLLASYEAKYGLPTLRRYILAHRLIDSLSWERQLRYLQAYIQYCEVLYQEYLPEVLITGAPDCLQFLTLYSVFKYNGVLPVLLGQGRMPGRIFIVDNELEQIPGLQETYAEFKSADLTGEDLTAARTFRASYSGQKIRPSYYWHGPSLRALPSLMRFGERIKRLALEDDRYFQPRLSETIRRSILTRVKDPLMRRELRRHAFDLPSAPFFYYPLHYEPESAIDVFSAYFRDQVQVLRWVSAALPAGYRLVVKEHPHTILGTRPLGYYRRLAKIPFVDVVPTSTDSYEILARCAGVITLAGTTGFEALCLGKPVVLFGHAFYQPFEEGVFRPLTIDKLASLLQRVAESPRVDDNLLDKFLAAVLKTTYPGAFDHTNDASIAPDNLATICHEIIRRAEVWASQGLTARGCL